MSAQVTTAFVQQYSANVRARREYDWQKCFL